MAPYRVRTCNDLHALCTSRTIVFVSTEAYASHQKTLELKRYAWRSTFPYCLAIRFYRKRGTSRRICTSSMKRRFKEIPWIEWLVHIPTVSSCIFFPLYRVRTCNDLDALSTSRTIVSVGTETYASHQDTLELKSYAWTLTFPCCLAIRFFRKRGTSRRICTSSVTLKRRFWWEIPLPIECPTCSGLDSPWVWDDMRTVPNSYKEGYHLEFWLRNTKYPKVHYKSVQRTNYKSSSTQANSLNPSLIFYAVLCHHHSHDLFSTSDVAFSKQRFSLPPSSHKPRRKRRIWYQSRRLSRLRR